MFVNLAVILKKQMDSYVWDPSSFLTLSAGVWNFFTFYEIMYLLKLS